MSLKILSVVLALGITCAVRAATVHIAAGGNDGNDGSQIHPFATLKRARDEGRKLAARGPVTVIVHGGTYVLSESLELGPDDTGTWLAEGGEVRLSGGPTLSSAAFSSVKDQKTLERLNPSARGNVVQADLTQLGDLSLGEYPNSFRGVPAAPELFFNDQRMTVARWPNSGWATIDKIIEPGSVPREGDTSGKVGVFQYSGDEPSRWNADAGVWLLGYWAYDWYDQAIRVKSIDRERKQITLAAPALYGVKQGNPSPRRYRAINLLEELDEPGEFFIDRAARKLYFWPPGPMDKARLTLSTLNAPLIRVKDAKHITIRGMIFEATLGDGIDITDGEDVRIEHCTIRNARLVGINAVGGKGHLIDHCEIYDTGTGGIVLEGGDRKTLTPAGHVASNNRIRDFSRHQQTGAYAISLGGVGNLVTHNLVERAPHQAIFIGGNDHVIEYNIIRNVVTETDDAGAVYKGRNPSCRGNVIRYNFFSDIGSPMGHGTAAIYFDDGDGGDTVFGNIFVRCGYPGRGSFGTVFSHGGHAIHADNNIFVDCKRALGSAPWDDARWKNALNGGEDCDFPKKLLQEVDITKPPYTTRYPELVGFMNPKPGVPRVSFAKNNVLVRAEEISSGNWMYDKSEIWQTKDDPGFVDAAKGKFELRSDSEVFKHLPDFHPIPFKEIGPK